MRWLLGQLTVIVILIFVNVPFSAQAATTGQGNLTQAQSYVTQAIKFAEDGKIDQAQASYNKFNQNWLKIEDSIKPKSAEAYKDIESAMGQVEYAFLQKKEAAVVSSLKDLQKVDQKFINGHYASGKAFKKENISLSDFIGLLKTAKAKTEAGDQASALTEIKQVRESWLSVEGKVVSQSDKVYNQSERDMVTVNAMIQAKNYQGASDLLGQMIGYLSPLAKTTGYSLWDAAMIPIREGLEALLVVGALLAFVKKTNKGRGKGWIWTGVTTGILVSVLIAFAVKFIFNSGAFGNNNFLIAGITGLFASAMLLYMSYWLHSKSNIAEWNAYIKTKSQAALTSGSMISLGLLSFLAIFREGTETVLFVIGMVNDISLKNLIFGLLVGLMVLIVIAILMFVIGMKLPIRPFFMVSSLIIFYLCLKFTGLGVHSLQLAGMIPTTLSKQLPSIDFLAIFPTWESTVPQLILLLFAITVFLFKRYSAKKVAD
jgi:high-affinity iron transporter